MTLNKSFASKEIIKGIFERGLEGGCCREKDGGGRDGREGKDHRIW